MGIGGKSLFTCRSSPADLLSPGYSGVGFRLFQLFVVSCIYNINHAVGGPVLTTTPKPPPKYNYTLELSYTGPACLDSIMEFTAKLFDNSGHSVESKFFHYQWMNNANHSYEYSTGQYRSSLQKTFDSDSIVPGQYIMTVSVYGDKDNKRILAYSSLKFILTGRLNGKLNVSQNLPYQRNKTIFATGRPTLLSLDIRDKFDSHVRFQYFWYKNNTLFASTTKANHSVVFDKAGNHTVEVMVHIMSFTHGQNHTRNWWRHPPKRLRKDSCDRTLNGAVDKCGQYAQNLVTKERLTVLDIGGGTSVAVNSFITLNISCLGSSPTGVCWNVTALNRTHLNDNITCVPPVFTNTSCYHQISVRPKNKGWHDVKIAVYNDVSFMHGNYYVFAYETDVKHSSMVTIPVAFSILVVMIVAISSVYIWKLRKKPYIEVADFEFHPSIARNDSWEIFSAGITRIKQWFRRRTNTLSVNSDSGSVTVTSPISHSVDS